MTMNDNTQPLIAALQNSLRYEHPIIEITLFEIHIAWMILTGYYAYKIKKPVNLGFLDFSTLEKRHDFKQDNWIDY